MTALRPVVAHQGGWDEIAYLVVPIALVILGVRWAERRARSRAEADERVEDVDVDEEPAP